MAERRVELPPHTRETAVAQTSPIEIARDIERRWQLRSSSPIGLALKHDDAGKGHCPDCNEQACIAPMSSEYRGKGIIHHHWLCNACGHQWVTVVQVPK
jgi:hypothetical protein